MIPLFSRLLLCFLGLSLIGGCMLTDRRSPPTVWHDKRAERELKNEIGPVYSDKNGNHINITVYDEKVLFTGQVPDENTKQALTQYAQGLENISTIYNEVTIGPVTGLVQRSHDTWITAKIKSYFTASNKIGLMRMSVTTENGTVFLMGLVTYAEADKAVETARSVQGVKEVTKIFEYVD